MSDPIYDAMSTLRAVRRLRSQPIAEDVLQRILQAAAWAPSGGNVQPWRVMVVLDKDKRAALGDLYRPRWARYAEGSRANLARLTGDALAKQERMLAAADHLGEHFGEAPAILVFCVNPIHVAITDAKWIMPVGLADKLLQNAMLACRVEGIGCTLTTLLCLDEDAVKSLLEIPARWYTCAFMPIGYPVGGGHGPISRRPVAKLAYRDVWGDGFMPEKCQLA